MVTRRGLFGWLGGGSAAIASRAFPVVERTAPKLWDQVMRAGRLHFWNGVRWVKAYSNDFLVK